MQIKFVKLTSITTLYCQGHVIFFTEHETAKYETCYGSVFMVLQGLHIYNLSYRETSEIFMRSSKELEKYKK